MAVNRVYTESVVTLNNQEATARLDEIRRKALEVRQEMFKLAQTKGVDSKEFRAAQKELISLVNSEKSLNEETKRFEKTLKNLNGSTLNELQSAMRKLQQQMRRTKPDTPEFKAYAEQLKSVRTRMRELEDESRTAQKTLGGFFSKIGWTALVTGALALIRKFGADMVAQTQLAGDKWRAEVAGWKSAYGSFVADLSSGKGWNELVQRMKDAYKNGKQVAEMLDEIFERENSLSLTEGELNLKGEQQRKIMMDSTKSLQERIAAAEEYDTIQKKIAQGRKDVAQQELDAYQLQLQQRTELTDAELDAFVKDYNANKDLIDQAKAYQKEYSNLQTRANGLHKAMISGTGQAYDAYKAQYEQAQADLDNFAAAADETVVRWAGIIDKYNLGNDDMVKNYVQARRKMIDADVNYERSTQRSNRQATTLRKQLANEAQQAQEKAYQADIKASEERFQTLQLQAKQAYADGTISETEYQGRINHIQEEALKDKIAIGERFKKSVVALQSQILDLSIAESKKLREILDNEEKALEKTIEDLNAGIQKELDEMSGYLDEQQQEFNSHWSEMLSRADEIAAELNPVAALKEEMAKELAEIQELLDSSLITDEEFQQKRLEIIKRYAQKQTELAVEPYKNGAQTAQKYLEQVGDFVAALQDAAAARMEAQMQAELTAAGDNAEKREQIEADYTQKQLDLQKRYANINMGIEIAKTISAGALAVMQGFAELGPIGGAVSAALIAATTAAQVAVIIAQRNAIMNSSVSASGSSSSIEARVPTGYSGGGFTEKRANDYQPVGIVHANEWVAPAAMVRANPLTFATLESMRLSGNYHSGQRGFADGGYTTPAPAAQRAGNTADMELIRRTYELLSELKAALPFPTYLVFSQASAKQEVMNEIKKIVGK